MSAILSHNLLRILQMQGIEFGKRCTEKRSPLLRFEEASTIRRHLIHRAGRLTRPQGRLRLTMSGNEKTRDSIRKYLIALKPAA